ncbi:MAG: acyltransferase [Rhodospirillales bacterium]|nr:acyltransferase [Rhodospirillales bacterium]
MLGTTKRGAYVRAGTERIASLDVLRGFAAGAVMLHHHGQYYDVLYPGRIPLSVDLGPGHFGVELFFIISGFVILMTIERKKTVREFAISRVARLMPAFLAALILATVIRSLSPVPLLDTPTVPQFLANLTMAPNLLGQTGMDMPYWTLTYELVFYVGMGLLLAIGMLRWTEWFGLLAVAVSCLFIATLDVRLHHRSSILLLVYYSNFFLIGICLYRIHAQTARPITWLALVVAVAVTALGGGEKSFDTPGRVYLPLAIAFTALVWFAISRHGRWLVWRPLVFLGQISYPLYLVHVALGFLIIRWAAARGWGTLEGVVAAGVVSLIAATLMHYCIELPGGRWLRTALSRRQPPAIAA